MTVGGKAAAMIYGNWKSQTNPEVILFIPVYSPFTLYSVLVTQTSFQKLNKTKVPSTETIQQHSTNWELPHNLNRINHRPGPALIFQLFSLLRKHNTDINPVYCGVLIVSWGSQWALRLSIPSTKRQMGCTPDSNSTAESVKITAVGFSPQSSWIRFIGRALCLCCWQVQLSCWRLQTHPDRKHEHKHRLSVKKA